MHNAHAHNAVCLLCKMNVHFSKDAVQCLLYSKSPLLYDAKASAAARRTLSVTVHELFLGFPQQVFFWQLIELSCNYKVIFCETIAGMRPQFHQDLVPALPINM